MTTGEDPLLPIDLGSVLRRTRAYVLRCERWLEQRQTGHALPSPDCAVTVVTCMTPVLDAEVVRALDGWVSPDRHELSDDPEAAAATALAAIERSREAWLTLIRTQQVRALVAAPFVTDLVWLKHEVERAFPNARAPVQN